MNALGVSNVTVAWNFVYGTIDTLKASTVGIYVTCFCMISSSDDASTMYTVRFLLESRSI